LSFELPNDASLSKSTPSQSRPARPNWLCAPQPVVWLPCRVRLQPGKSWSNQIPRRGNRYGKPPKQASPLQLAMCSPSRGSARTMPVLNHCKSTMHPIGLNQVKPKLPPFPMTAPQSQLAASERTAFPNAIRRGIHRRSTGAPLVKPGKTNSSVGHEPTTPQLAWTRQVYPLHLGGVGQG